jgi:hypothetical protein
MMLPQDAIVPSNAVLETQADHHVVIITLSHTPSERATAYAEFLIGKGVEVDMIVVDRKAAGVVTLPCRVHPVVVDEMRMPLRWLENVIVYRLPGGALARAQRLATRARLTRVANPAIASLVRIHRRLAGVFHRRVFMRLFTQVRPWLLARRARSVLRGIDLSRTERIVVADTGAVTLGWRMARRVPRAVATTVLDRKPYSHL